MACGLCSVTFTALIITARCDLLSRGVDKRVLTSARVVAAVSPWPPDGSEPDCRDEAAWASALGGLTCAEVAVNASSRCHMRSVDGWAARDACACACDDVMYEPHGTRRRLLRSKDSSIQGEHRALLDVRVPQASNQDDRRKDGVAASA